MENDKKQKINTPTAIIVAGFLIMLALLITNGGSGIGNKVTKEKTLSEQVGISKDKMAACLKAIDSTALQTSIAASVEAAMKALPNDQRGTPYSVIVGKNGSKSEVRGADSIDNIKKLIAEVESGKVAAPYKGEVPAVTAEDHIIGSIDAPIIIVEYSDYECPYCKAFQTTIKQIVADSNGNVAWVFRHWPIHQNSFSKLVAAECVAKIKGNDAFWKYSDLLFGLLKTAADPVTDQL
ncbi:MAG: thioredoxin domain-containing protein [Candidatus Nomurabacteria bacterium]